MKPILVFLTCANPKEAELISKALLERKLVVCIKKTKVSSNFLWKKRIDKSDEVLLIMDSVEEKFEDLEKEVKKHHSYDTFVLVAVPVVRASKGIIRWMREEFR